MHTNLPKILKKTVEQHALLPPEERVVLAVSGGADSLALLHALAQMPSVGSHRLHVATLDHGLRGEEGARDAAFVRDFAGALNIPCTVGQTDVGTIATKNRMGVEEAARITRYDFLGRVAAQVGSSTVATGHHADDQAETILLHILRGAGLQGLRGMAYQTTVPGQPHLRLVRPLLDVSRTLIAAYCEEHGLQPRHDATNDNPAYTRNRIRLQILPALREINPQVDTALVRMGQAAAEDESLLSEMFAREILPQIERTAGRFTWKLDAFHGWHPAMQARALRYAIEELAAHPDHEQIMRARLMAQNPEVGVMMPFNQGVRLRFGYGEMAVERDDAPMPQHTYWLLHEPYNLQLPGRTRCGEWELIAAEDAQADVVARMALPPDARIALRTRQPGDRWQPMGMAGHTRSLKNWMIDQKIPRHLRDYLPLLTVDSQIAAIILPDEWRIAEPFAVQPSSQHVFYFSVRRL